MRSSKHEAQPKTKLEDKDMSAERRLAERKLIDSILICDLTSLNNYNMIAKEGHIVDASISGFLMLIARHDLVDDDLKQNLSLEAVVGQDVVLYLPQMNLDLDGTIKRAVHKGRGVFEVAVDFSAEVPEYWRECLIELLPKPGELE